MLKSYLKSVVIKAHHNPLQIVRAGFVALFVSFLLLTLLSCDDIINQISTNGCEDTDSVGVWKFLGLENETVTAIAVHPQKPSIIYAGTAKDFSAGIPGRLYKSTDCGKSWNVIMEVADYSFTQILFDPHNSNTIYALPQMLLKSTDGGITWADISSGITINWETRVAEIAIDRKNSNIIYAGTGGFFGGTLYKSTNGGLSWQNLYRNEDETPGLRNGVISLAIDPNNSNIIYAETADVGVLLKSSDAGYSWAVTGLGETGQLIRSITIDNNSTQTIYAAISHSGFFRSLNAGNSWQPFNEGLGDSAHAIKLIQNTINSDLFGLASSKDTTGTFVAGLYGKKMSNPIWNKISIANTITDSNSDIYISDDGKNLYFGTYKGVYKIKLPGIISLFCCQ